MNRLRQPGDSHYDVLGVSPGASAQEIERAFRQLIDGEGYRVGVPLNRQWLRARQIKDAHEALGDPEKRQAYDATLGGPAETVPWALTATDPGTDELVLSEKAPDVPEPVASGSATDEGAAGSAELATAEPEAVPAVAPGPEEEAELVHADPLTPDPAATFNDNESAPEFEADGNKGSSLRNWRVGAVFASVLGLVLVASWPGLDRQLSTSEEPAGVTTGAWASRAGQGSGPQAPGNPGSAPGQQAAFPRQGPAESDAPDQSTGSPRTTNESATPGVAEVATSDVAAAQSPAAAAPTGAPAPASVGPSGPTAAVEPQTEAPASSVAGAPSTEAATARIEGPSSPARRSAQWIGGGPTDADNPRGRYQGNLEVQVMVDANGRVSSCAPVRGSGNAGLDALTCRLVKERARFTPALDAQGRPVASEAYTSFVWGRTPRQ